MGGKIPKSLNTDRKNRYVGIIGADVRKCSECGEEFRIYRRDAKTCGTTCRKRRSRRLAKMDALGY